MNTPKTIIIGKFASVHGIKGWIKVHSYTEPQANILNYMPWLMLLNGIWQEIPVIDTQQHGKNIIVLLEGYSSPEVSRQLTNADIAIYRHQLPNLTQNEYYWSDLEGLTVINQAGVTLGKVANLIATGANDVLVVVGDKRHLIPYLLDQVILNIDLNKQQILVNWDADF